MTREEARLRELLDEAVARIALALDSIAKRTPEMEALAVLIDGPLAECWCANRHRGACPEPADVVWQLEQEIAEDLAISRAQEAEARALANAQSEPMREDE